MSPQNIQLAVLIGLGVIVLALVIWLLIRANRTTTIVGDETHGKDVLDEGAAPAARNHALIDAPRTESVPPPAVPASQPVTHEEPAPVPATAPVAPTPTPAPTAAPTPTASPEPVSTPAPAADDLSKIKGIGPKLVVLLAEQGITRFAQIAAWSDADIERIDAGLGRFEGRITRDHWVEQAKLLVSGEDSAFSQRFGQNK